MPPDLARLARLAAELRHDLAAAGELRDTIEELAGPKGEAYAPQSGRWASLAIALHNYYGSMESGWQRIARTLDGGITSGVEWHKDLLLSMTLEIPGVRSAVLASSDLPWLQKLCGFRHFFRHAYAIDLDGDELLRHADRVLSGHASVEHATLALCQALVPGE